MINIKKSVENLEQYNVGGRSNLSPDWECFDWNESEFPPSNKIFDAIKNFYRYERYPDITAANLKENLSSYVSLPQNFIEVYNGSDDALRDIFSVFVDTETEVLSYQPSYTQIDPFITINTKNYKRVHIEDPLGDHQYDFTHCEYANVVYLVNPNNLTVKIIVIENIERIVKTFPDVLFIVDEAYYEFAKKSCCHLVFSNKNLIVTRTFSKAFGLASVRLGYVIAHPDLLNNLNKVRNGKSVNSLAQLCGIAALNDLDYLDSRIDEMNDAKRFFMHNLSSRYFAVESFTNFVLVKTPNAKSLLNKMKENKILIRDRSSFQNLENCVRITIGSKKQIIKVLDVMNK